MLELVLDKRAFPPFESLLNCILYFLLDKKNEGFLVLRVLSSPMEEEGLVRYRQGQRC